jgi:hypothetical protein
MTKPKKTDVRLSKKALFGGLGYVPHEGQWTVHRSKAKRRIVACGTRWGKSTLAAYEAIAFLLEPRDSALGWIVAPTYELTRKIFDRVVAVLHSSFGHRVVEYDHRAHSIVVANWGGGRSELRARSADRPAGLLGDAIDFLIVDEAVKIREDVWDQYLAARTVDRDGRVLLISTPGSVNSWFFREYRRAKKDADYASFSMPTATNPHISPAVIEAERTRLQPDDFRSQYGAEFLGLDTTPCATCGGPDRYASQGVHLHGAEKPRYCPDCGLMVHEDGKTAVAVETWRGEASLNASVIVWLDDTTEENLELPTYCRRLFIDTRTMRNPEELPPGCE